MKKTDSLTADSQSASSSLIETASVPASTSRSSVPLVLSFDVEEHHRIEAAVGLEIHSALKGDYRQRMRRMTDWILEQLADGNIRATFFIVGQIADDEPRFVRSIHEAGHEVGSHGWDHRRILVMNPESLGEDLKKSKDALEQATGAAVVGYRAPTFSLVRQTAWALDVLVDAGFLYDSSIYPVRHDRYGIADAPRGPFLARGIRHEILEIPPATVRICGVNIPIGGGGYFRLLPSSVMRLALACSRRDPQSGATCLYFHPWEFDPDQPRLPLPLFSRFRTYVGVGRSRARLFRLLSSYSFSRAIDLVERLQNCRPMLPRFCPAS